MISGANVVVGLYRPWGFLLFDLLKSKEPSFPLLSLSFTFNAPFPYTHHIVTFLSLLLAVLSLPPSLSFLSHISSISLLVSQVSFGCNSRTLGLSQSHPGTQCWCHCVWCHWWVSEWIKATHKHRIYVLRGVPDIKFISGRHKVKNTSVFHNTVQQTPNWSTLVYIYQILIS